MKIIAEFNSVEELSSFINTFGNKPLGTIVANKIEVVGAAASTESNKVVKNEDKPKDIIKEIVPVKEEDLPKDDKKEESKDEEPKVTKEMIRERLGVIMKKGKQKEVKELVAKYGASKVPDIKEEDYAAIYQEAEGLI